MKKTGGFRELSAFVECSTGSTPTIKSLKKMIDILSAFGYTQLYLGLTDAYKMEGEPYFNFCRGGYTTEMLQEIDAYAEARDIELRVNIQVLGHLHFLPRHACYAPLMDTDHSMMVGKEEVYHFIDKMLSTMSKSVKSRTIHIGMDEIYDLGRGRYLDVHDYADRRTLFLQHLNRVAELAKKYDYTCEIWSDMFLHMVQGSTYGDSGVIPADVRDSIPDGVSIVHWYYFNQSEETLRRHIQENMAICDSLTFAGCARKSFGLAPDNIHCIDTIEQQMKQCRQEGVEKYMVTMWSDNGAHCSNFAVLPTLFAASEYAKGKTKAEIDKAKFKEIIGVEFDDFMLLDNLNNPFFKELDDCNNRCYWGLLSDLFLGSYDLLLDSGSNDAYEVLSSKYEAVESGEYHMMFENYRLYAKVLAVKMNLGVNIRKAYRAKDVELLKQYATVEIPKLIAYMEEFVDHFEDWWLTENMAFGVEIHHLFYGGQLRRWKYEAKRLLQFLDDGQPIEEMEREELPPSMWRFTTEDNCSEVQHRHLISYCGY